MDVLGWFVIGKEGYAVRTESDEENFVIYLTDMASIWFERQTAADIMKRCQVSFLNISTRLFIFWKMIAFLGFKSFDWVYSKQFDTATTYIAK